MIPTLTIKQNLIPELRLQVKETAKLHSLRAVEILENPGIYSEYIVFTANNGTQYIYYARNTRNKGIFAGIAFEVYCDLYGSISTCGLEDELNTLTTIDYLKFLNQPFYKKLWQEEVE